LDGHGATARRATRRETLRAISLVGAALVLAFGGVAAVGAFAGDSSADTPTGLAVGAAAPHEHDATTDGHDGDHEHDGAGAESSHDVGQHADSDGHADGDGSHGHDDGSATVDDHASGGHTGGSGHVSTAGHTSNTGSTGTHSHGPSTSPTTHGGDHTHTPPPPSGGPTTPTTAHTHTPPPTQPPGGSTTPTTAGHSHPPTGGVVQLGDLPPSLQAQVASVRDWAMQFPTPQAATAAGWTQATVFFPGIATHYLNWSLLDGTFDPARPEVLLYNASGQLVGVNYIVNSGAAPPAGFAGDLDGWHEHPVLCVSSSTGLIIAAEETTAAACRAMGGFQYDFSGRYLLHVWCIPGWESPEGIFSHENSRVV
jgi:hypothetical protein